MAISVLRARAPPSEVPLRDTAHLRHRGPYACVIGEAKIKNNWGRGPQCTLLRTLALPQWSAEAFRTTAGGDLYTATRSRVLPPDVRHKTSFDKIREVAGQEQEPPSWAHNCQDFSAFGPLFSISYNVQTQKIPRGIPDHCGCLFMFRPPGCS